MLPKNTDSPSQVRNPRSVELGNLAGLFFITFTVDSCRAAAHGTPMGLVPPIDVYLSGATPWSHHGRLVLGSTKKFLRLGFLVTYTL